MKTNAVRLNFYHWCSKKNLATTPNFLHIFRTAPVITVLCTIENSRTICEIFDL